MMRTLSLLVALSVTCACTAIGPKPGVYEVKTVPMQLPHGELPITVVKPVAPSPGNVMILFATGDAGWLGASKGIFEHIIDRGYAAAAFSSQRVVSNLRKAKELIGFEQVASDVDLILVESKKALGLPADAPVIVAGFSRGANVVVFAAGEPSLRRHIVGGVALALTAETDYVKPPAGAHLPPSIELDDKGRMRTYPALARLGDTPIAVIQSAGDSYVPADESRKLFGPNTDTRRLYEVKATSHGFSGGRDEMLKDLDEALDWIVAKKP
ncbi:MAG TPA: AcvB/VirJ family lysyl-phosphatidylglycerol hydrolase [Candidatus Polarisedimenticolaceae bacterium]|nr:AcvB/VirJ family lysyl-phosphatidylglycerol hydrolase [Candidatus Polarisedimenticolaceae bacterium]